MLFTHVKVQDLHVQIFTQAPELPNSSVLKLHASFHIFLVLDFCQCFADVAKRLLLVSPSKKASNTGRHNTAELTTLLLRQNIMCIKTDANKVFFWVSPGSVIHLLSGLSKFRMAANTLTHFHL